MDAPSGLQLSLELNLDQVRLFGLVEMEADRVLARESLELPPGRTAGSPSTGSEEMPRISS